MPYSRLDRAARRYLLACAAEIAAVVITRKVCGYFLDFA